MDDKSAGFVGYARLLLNVLLSWGSEGVQREGKSGGSLLFFLGAVATATPSSESNAKLKKFNAIEIPSPRREQ